MVFFSILVPAATIREEVGLSETQLEVNLNRKPRNDRILKTATVFVLFCCCNTMAAITSSRNESHPVFACSSGTSNANSRTWTQILETTKPELHALSWMLLSHFVFNLPCCFYACFPAKIRYASLVLFCHPSYMSSPFQNNDAVQLHPCISSHKASEDVARSA